MNRRILLCLALATCLMGGSAAAEDLPAPAGPVILTLTGQIGVHNAGDTAVFDLAMLESLGGRTTHTTTPWYDGSRSFTGPLGAALLEAVGASGDMLRITALNDYVSDIPVSDFNAYPVILATRLDGQTMSVRDKGPIFVIYPFDELPELNNETYYGRSAWQVKSIEVY